MMSTPDDSFEGRPERDPGELRRRAEQFIKEVQNLSPSLPIVHTNEEEAAFQKALGEKFRKQGLDV